MKHRHGKPSDSDTGHIIQKRPIVTWLRSFRGLLIEKKSSQLIGDDIQNFLSSLAVERKVSPSTQNQALNAFVFIYRYVLEKEIGKKELDTVRAIYKRRLPVALTVKEVHSIFDHLSEVQRIMAMLTYGCSLRFIECIRLRIKDIDLEQNVVIVRSGKGDKDPGIFKPPRFIPTLPQRIY